MQVDIQVLAQVGVEEYYDESQYEAMKELENEEGVFRVVEG